MKSPISQLVAVMSKSSFISVVKILSKRDRIFLSLTVFITLALAFLDLVGVLMIGVIGSLSITSLSSSPTGNRVSAVLDSLGIRELNIERQVIIVGLFAASILVLKTLLSLLLVKKTMFFMARRAAVISTQLVSRYFTMSLSGINKRSAQSSIYALTGGVNSIMVGVLGTWVALVSDIGLLFVMSVGLWFVDPFTALATGILFGLLALTLYKFMHMKSKTLGEQQGLLGIESSQKIFEAISTYRELLVRNRRSFYAKKIGDLRLKMAEGEASAGFMRNLSKYILEIAIVVMSLSLAFYHFSTTTPSRAIATILVFMAASTRITPAVLRIQQGFLNIKYALAQGKPTLKLIEELMNVTGDNSEIRKISRNHGGFSATVRVTNVSFSYPETGEVLKQIDFHASPGEFLALVGNSGAGKTTLVDVILGALEPQSGSVKISESVPKETFSSWPGAVAYVPQDSIIIEGTIRENLGLGYPKSDLLDDYCWESLKIAQLDEFVRSLPNELDSYVGDRGTRLSGGQRQRLGLARALLTKPKLLFLDEATSSLDAITENEISDSLRKLKGEITLIVIAHRLSTVVQADRIYLLEQGSIQGVGSFEKLKCDYPEFLKQAELMGL